MTQQIVTTLSPATDKPANPILTGGMLSAQTTNTMLSQGTQFPKAFSFTLDSEVRAGADTPHIQFSEGPCNSREIMRFSNTDGKLVVTGDLTTGGAMLIAQMQRQLGMEPVPFPRVDPHTGTLRVARFTVEGIFYVVPVDQVEKPGGLSELYHLLDTDEHIQIEILTMTAEAYNKLGDFNGF